ncbi:MAG: 50S ribosomal protein L33 [candidate division WOR-3 bacterium]|nr:50S ribosomal protein L33 [candidate division WOR-3 bacterium]
MRIIVRLECNECKSRNYTTTRKKDERSKLQLNKYCPRCKKHTLHKEV